MQGKYNIYELVNVAMQLLSADLLLWCGAFPLDGDQCRSVLKAGIQAGLMGKSAQFYAAQWMAQVYAMKPDIALMRLLTRLDTLCLSYLDKMKSTRDPA